MSKYKYVYPSKQTRNGKNTSKFVGQIQFKNIRWQSKYFDCERLCAIEVDKYLISIGKEPVNILIKK